jgi:hypothetical protein
MQVPRHSIGGGLGKFNFFEGAAATPPKVLQLARASRSSRILLIIHWKLYKSLILQAFFK